MTPHALAQVAGTLVPTSYGWALVKMLLALAIVCALAYFLLRWGLRRLAGPRPGGLVTVIERYPLSASRSLWIVEVQGRRLLLGSSEGGISLLTELPTDSARAGSRKTPTSFREQLGRSEARRAVDAPSQGAFDAP